MSFQKKTSRGFLHTLLRDFGHKARRIKKLSSRISQHEYQAASQPSLFRRLTAWVDQLILLRNKERDLLSQINAIEEKHRKLRGAKKLKVAAPRLSADAPAPSNAKKNRLFWFLLALLWMMTRGKKSRPLFSLRNG